MDTEELCRLLKERDAKDEQNKGQMSGETLAQYVTCFQSITNLPSRMFYSYSYHCCIFSGTFSEKDILALTWKSMMWILL